MKEKQSLLRRLPAVDRVMGTQPLAGLSGRFPRVLLLEGAQQAVAELRCKILQDPGTAENLDLSPSSAAARATEIVRAKAAPSLRRVINATGVLLHTNLGRAPLSSSALAAVHSVATSYSNLEFDLTSGSRGQRHTHVEGLLCRLTGAEAATVVNNNAGALVLALAALAGGKEVIVSRGELVEIGGSFRVPEVMSASGCRLREVGTTNKTHLSDYEQAIGPETGLLLKVHTSNYRIVGFTAAVSSTDLVTLGAERNLPVLEDLGSGMLFDLSPFGLPREPTVSEAVASGLDAVTFSGDKLLGGPQAGLIVGRKWALDKIRRHPLARALRIDKMTLAALEATLRHYLDHEEALREIPVLRMLSLTSEETRSRCLALAEGIAGAIGDAATVETVPDTSQVGGGALPLTELPGFAVALIPRYISVDDLAARLREGTPPLVARIQEGRLLLNPRTLTREEEELLPGLLAATLETTGNG
jgi:L-seryl-tRNA(Ser) seleniumtransferase